MDWTRAYFGDLYGDIYRKFLLDPNTSRAEAKFAIQAIGLRPGETAVDIASGFGRHAHVLAAHRVRTLALDLAGGFLRTAIDTAPTKARPHLTATRGDMRQMPLATASADAALLLFNSFGYFGAREAWDAARGLDTSPTQRQVWKLPSVFYDRGLVAPTFGMPAGAGPLAPPPPPPPAAANALTPESNVEVLREIARILKPGGRLLLEAPEPSAVLTAYREAPRRRMIGRGFELAEEFDYEPSVKVFHARTQFKMGTRTDDGAYWLRLFSLTEIRKLFRQAQLDIQTVFGSYEGEPHQRGAAMMLILAHRRP